jgi:glycine/D-amino acid oxidase-like deaminating enzyme
VREHVAAGHDVRIAGRSEVAKLEPRLRGVPQCAAFAPSEGTVNPSKTTEILVEAAKEAGAQVRSGTEVVSLEVTSNRVTGVHTSKGLIGADVVVVAAGVATNTLVQPLGVTVPVESSPCILVRYGTTGRVLNKVVQTPELEVRQATDTVMSSTESYVAPSGDNGPEAMT